MLIIVGSRLVIRLIRHYVNLKVNVSGGSEERGGGIPYDVIDVF